MTDFSSLRTFSCSRRTFGIRGAAFGAALASAANMQQASAQTVLPSSHNPELRLRFEEAPARVLISAGARTFPMESRDGQLVGTLRKESAPISNYNIKIMWSDLETEFPVWVLLTDVENHDAEIIKPLWSAQRRRDVIARLLPERDWIAAQWYYFGGRQDFVALIQEAPVNRQSQPALRALNMWFRGAYNASARHTRFFGPDQALLREVADYRRVASRDATFNEFWKKHFWDEMEVYYAQYSVLESRMLRGVQALGRSGDVDAARAILGRLSRTFEISELGRQGLVANGINAEVLQGHFRALRMAVP